MVVTPNDDVEISRQGLSVSSQLSTSAFSAAVHSRPTTSLQLRRNHFSVFSGSVKRSRLTAGASAPISLPVEACLPVWMGTAPWHDAQLQSRPWREVKNFWPRSGAAAAPACAL